MNVGDLGKLIVAKGFKKLPKVKKIATSGHTISNVHRMRPRYLGRQTLMRLNNTYFSMTDKTVKLRSHCCMLNGKLLRLRQAKYTSNQMERACVLLKRQHC